jgi:hypothetical protein
LLTTKSGDARDGLAMVDGAKAEYEVEAARGWWR